MHSHEHEAKSQSSLIITLSVTAIIMFVEFLGGVFSNSLALLSDSGHMLTDVFSLAFALLAFWVARKVSGNVEKTYGYYRLEILSALANGVILVLIAIAIFWGAFRRFYSPHEINSNLMMIVALVGLLANLFSIYILSPHSKENLNIKGAFRHVASDTLSSIGVIIGGLIIMFTGFTAIDPILSIIIGLLILRGAYDILTESISILLEAVPESIELPNVIKSIKEIEGVKNIHDLHIWTITSGYHALSAHIDLEDAKLSECSGILDKIEDMLHDKFNIEHATLQPECESCEGGMICSRPHKH
ncbi:cation transporter [Candidatus Saganbacteria bacterium]|nr:cation transporter [Candidatus Saganbacteria bacterium]